MPNRIENPTIKSDSDPSLNYHLRQKELAGTLPYNEFIELIESDIQTYFSKFPGLGTNFNYLQELRKLSSSIEIDKTVKKEKLKELQSSHVRQIQGMAFCRTILERLVDQNQGINITELKKYLERFGSYYGLPDFKLDGYKSIIDKFEQGREIINEVLEQYPDSEKLIKILFADEPNFNVDSNTPFQIEYNPYAIIVNTSPEIISTLHPDAAGISYVKQIIIDKSKIINKSNSNAESLSLFSTEKVNVPVIVIPLTDDNSFIKKHEIEHIKNKFWMENIEKKINLDFINDILKTKEEIAGYDKEIFVVNKLLKLITLDSENKEIVSRELSEIEKNKTLALDLLKYNTRFSIYEAYFVALEKAKDEIIAMKKDGESDYFSLLGKDPYSYLNLNYYVNKFKEDLNNNGFQNLSSQIPDIESLFTNQISVSVSSFDELVSKGGLTQSEAIAILSFYPINSWPNAVNNIIQRRS